MTYYTNKNVVVTGGQGMIGSALCELLVKAGANVTSLDDESRGQVKIKGVKYEYADVRNGTSAYLKIRNADMVFSLAARVAGVKYNQNHQNTMMRDNIDIQMGTIEAAERAGVDRFLQVSSICIYSKEKQAPAVEGDEGNNPVEANYGYSMAKRIGEKALQMSNIPHRVIVRPTNVFGIHDYFDETAHVIPAIMKKFRHDAKVVLNGTGKETREFITREYAAKAMMYLMEYGTDGEAYNIGTGAQTAFSIETLAEMIGHTSGFNKTIVFKEMYNAGDNQRYTSIKKLRGTGFKTEKEAIIMYAELARVWDWYILQ